MYDEEHGPWKRGKKYKTASGEVVREFYQQKRSFDKIHVVVDTAGDLRIEEFRPDETWLFQFDDEMEPEDESHCVFCIVAKSYYDDDCFNDIHIYDAVKHLLPPNTDESCESMFESKGTRESIRAFLVSKGMIEIK